MLNIAGAVVAVVKDGQLLFSRGYGYSDYLKALVSIGYSRASQGAKPFEYMEVAPAEIRCAFKSKVKED
jgi:hypothetical protein